MGIYVIVVASIFLQLCVTQFLKDPTDDLSEEERIQFFKNLIKLQGRKIFQTNVTKTRFKKIRRTNIPKSFDARKKWPYCKDIIGYVDTQGSCGGCWAYTAASLISIRSCIESKGRSQIRYSYQDTVECASEDPDGCRGKVFELALFYYRDHGAVSGGGAYSQTGCKPLSNSVLNFNKATNQTLSCKKKCSNPGYYRTYQKDKKRVVDFYLIRDEKRMQSEMMTNGPIATCFDVFGNFFTHDWKNAVYTETTPIEGLPPGHAAMIIGWGEEKRVPYWLLVNSWGKNWGQNGLFKILRGKNLIDIEKFCYGLQVERKHRRHRTVSASDYMKPIVTMYVIQYALRKI